MFEIKSFLLRNINKYNDIKEYLLKYKPDEYIINDSINYLNSEKAINDIKLDPYWPKWITPWWHMTLLYEINLTHLIPQKISEQMLESLNTHFLKFFPLIESELPENIDPYREIICHCALGTMYKILSEKGFNIDKEENWTRNWFLKYQLEDGGLNCDESVYTSKNPKSSIVSTLPVLEAVLFNINNRTKEENDLLDKGANYYLKRGIFRKSGGDKSIINESWLKPSFPRFYEFDILRALFFLVNWSNQRKQKLPLNSIQESLEIIENTIDKKGYILNQKNLIKNESTLYFNGKEWSRKISETFPLLDKLSKEDEISIYLTKEWYKVIYLLDSLYKNDLLI